MPLNNVGPIICDLEVVRLLSEPVSGHLLLFCHQAQPFLLLVHPDHAIGTDHRHHCGRLLHAPLDDGRKHGKGEGIEAKLGGMAEYY